MSTQELSAEIDVLTTLEILVMTNEGTYDKKECLKKTGSENLEDGLCRVYETIGGEMDCRTAGVSRDNAPGKMKLVNEDELLRRRERLADLWEMHNEL